MKILTAIAVGDALGKFYANHTPTEDVGDIKVYLQKPTGSYNYLRSIDYTPYTRFMRIMLEAYNDFFLNNYNPSQVSLSYIVKSGFKSNYMKLGNLIPVTTDTMLVMFGNHIVMEDLSLPMKVSPLYDDYIPRDSFLPILTVLSTLHIPTRHRTTGLLNELDKSFIRFPSDLVMLQRIVFYHMLRLERGKFDGIDDFCKQFITSLADVGKSRSKFTLDKVLRCLLFNSIEIEDNLEAYLAKFVEENRFDFYIDLHTGIMLLTVFWANLFPKKSFPTKYRDINKFKELAEIDEVSF